MCALDRICVKLRADHLMSYSTYSLVCEVEEQRSGDISDVDLTSERVGTRSFQSSYIICRDFRRQCLD